MSRNLSSEGICEAIIIYICLSKRKRTSVSHPKSKLHGFETTQTWQFALLPKTHHEFSDQRETPPKPAPWDLLPTQKHAKAASGNPHLICRRFLWEQHDLKLSSCLHNWTNQLICGRFVRPRVFYHLLESWQGCVSGNINPCYFSSGFFSGIGWPIS